MQKYTPMKIASSTILLCATLICLALPDRFQIEAGYSDALAEGEMAALVLDKSLSLPVAMDINSGEPAYLDSEIILIADNRADNTNTFRDSDSNAVPGGPSSEEPDDDYLTPKTVYIGVDSIVAPDVFPETAALPQSTDASDISIDEQVAAPTVAPEVYSEQTAESEISDLTTDSQTDEVMPASSQTAVVIRKPESLTSNESFESQIELDVPSGLPEDITTDEVQSNTLNSENPGSDDVDRSGEIVEQAYAEENPGNTNKPAIIINKNDSTQINRQNKWGWTRLMSAAIEGDLDKVNKLLEQGADPDIVGKDGRSPLMAASWNKHNDVVEALINARADVNLINRDGWTALSFAAWNGDAQTVKNLLLASANKFLRTADGFTPLQLARQKGHQEIIELLK